MRKLSDEILRRFPELLGGVSPPQSDRPYDVMGELVHWLASQGAPGSSLNLLRRVVDFHDWCMDQPRGASSTDDIYTILVVGFYEELIKNQDTRAWITHLLPREELVDNREYLIKWIGREAFDLAVACYDSGSPSS